MRILIVRMYPNELDIKSYNSQEIGLAKALIRRGNVCDIVLFSKKATSDLNYYFDNKKNKIHIYYLRGKNFLNNIFYEKRLFSLIENYDIIQSSEYDQIMNIKLFKKIGKRLVIYHGPYLSNYTKKYNLKCKISDLYLFFNKNYKNVYCISKSILAKKMLLKKGFRKITNIGVGIDSEKFLKENNNEIIIKLLSDKKKMKLKYLLYIGKIEKRRDIIFLIKLFKISYSRNKNIRLLLVGNGTKKYVRKCIYCAKKLKVFNKIIFINKVDQEFLPTLYKNCDIFLLPSHYEIFGMVLLEAMYFGIPVISTLNGGSSTLISDKIDGFVIKQNNLNTWRESIEMLLNEDTYRNLVTSKAKKKIQENYLWDCLVNQFIKVYLDSLNEKRRKNEEYKN